MAFIPARDWAGIPRARISFYDEYQLRPHNHGDSVSAAFGHFSSLSAPMVLPGRSWEPSDDSAEADKAAAHQVFREVAAGIVSQCAATEGDCAALAKALLIKFGPPEISSAGIPERRPGGHSRNPPILPEQGIRGALLSPSREPQGEGELCGGRGVSYPPPTQSTRDVALAQRDVSFQMSMYFLIESLFVVVGCV